VTELLEKAFAKAAKLPATDQEALGAWILAELDKETQWDKVFAASHSALEQLADEALDEHRAGQTKPFRSS
jgi:hypothetical protein